MKTAGGDIIKFAVRVERAKRKKNKEQEKKGEVYKKEIDCGIGWHAGSFNRREADNVSGPRHVF